MRVISCHSSLAYENVDKVLEEGEIEADIDYNSSMVMAEASGVEPRTLHKALNAVEN